MIVANRLAKLFQSCRRFKHRRIATHSYMSFLAVVSDPRQVTRSKVPIEKAMKPRRTVERYSLKHIFNAHDPLAYCYRVADREQHASLRRRRLRCTGLSPTATIACYPSRSTKSCLSSGVIDIAGARHPFDSVPQRLFQKTLVEPGHAADAKLIMRARQFQRTPRGRMQCYVAHSRPKTICGNIEIFECSPHKDSGCVD